MELAQPSAPYPRKTSEALAGENEEQRSEFAFGLSPEAKDTELAAS